MNNKPIFDEKTGNKWQFGRHPDGRAYIFFTNGLWQKSDGLPEPQLKAERLTNYEWRGDFPLPQFIHDHLICGWGSV